ncbi:MAG: hypothetical protein P8Y94_14505, partial [Acidobacteriota bacterium]
MRGKFNVLEEKANGQSPKKIKAGTNVLAATFIDIGFTSVFGSLNELNGFHGSRRKFERAPHRVSSGSPT